MDEQTLFSNDSHVPMAENSRPSDIDHLYGQEHFLNEGFKRMLASDRWAGLIFWGPPGVGKTTLARIIAQKTTRPFIERSAVTSGTKDLREVLLLSEAEVRSGRKAHILFLDEVHRLNKAQQDVLLPFLEKGAIRFIGATTENPSFEINNAVISRSIVLNFKSLSEKSLTSILLRAAKQSDIKIEPDAIAQIANICGGDARRALSILECVSLSLTPGQTIVVDDIKSLAQGQNIYYDKKSENHYDVISAFIKSIRGSNAHAALYYLARMIEGGEDPLFIARRLIIVASEDIGNANPMGLVLATQAFQAVHSIGMPEGRIILAQVVSYLACSEKSNRSYSGIEKALAKVRDTGNVAVPMSLRNAVTPKMKQWGYGKDYAYAHNHPDAFVKMDYLPEELKGEKFYEPSERGVEKKLKDFMTARDL